MVTGLTSRCSSTELITLLRATYPLVDPSSVAPTLIRRLLTELSDAGDVVTLLTRLGNKCASIDVMAEPCELDVGILSEDARVPLQIQCIDRALTRLFPAVAVYTAEVLAPVREFIDQIRSLPPYTLHAVHEAYLIKIGVLVGASDHSQKQVEAIVKELRDGPRTVYVKWVPCMNSRAFTSVLAYASNTNLARANQSDTVITLHRSIANMGLLACDRFSPLSFLKDANALASSVHECTSHVSPSFLDGHADLMDAMSAAVAACANRWYQELPNSFWADMLRLVNTSVVPLKVTPVRSHTDLQHYFLNVSDIGVRFAGDHASEIDQLTLANERAHHMITVL